MLKRIRLLPVLISTAVVVLGVKVETAIESAAWPEVSRASAQSKQPAATPSGTSPATPTVAASEAAKAAASETKPAVDEKGDEAPAEAEASEPTDFTRAELEVLQSLAKRREALDRQARQLELSEGVLKATERRIDEKIARLKQLEAQIEQLLERNDQEEEVQIKSLVKVYEAMKPKEAARIFEKLEFEVLVAVTMRMREAKMAAILAKMDTARANELTVNLATRRQLPKLGG